MGKLNPAARTEPKKSYVPLLHFLAGLIITSVALVAAALSALKDAEKFPAWNQRLLSFIGWMAVTIIAATICAFFVQMSRANAGKDDHATNVAVWLTFFPIIPGVLAALHIIAFALSANAPIWP